jgi:hypothetical protein
LINEFDGDKTEDVRNFICYDLTEDHVLVFCQFVSINFYEEGKTDVESFQQRYSIKHNIVFPYEDEDFFDDLDEDISEIKNLLK